MYFALIPLLLPIIIGSLVLGLLCVFLDDGSFFDSFSRFIFLCFSPSGTSPLPMKRRKMNRLSIGLLHHRMFTPMRKPFPPPLPLPYLLPHVFNQLFLSIFQVGTKETTRCCGNRALRNSVALHTDWGVCVRIQYLAQTLPLFPDISVSPGIR